RSRRAPAHAAVGLADRDDRAGGGDQGSRDPAAPARRGEPPAAPHRRDAPARSDVQLRAPAGRRALARRRATRDPPGAAPRPAAPGAVLDPGFDPGGAMKARLETLLRRLGAMGIAGIGVLLACGAFYFSTLAPLEADAAAQRLALERLKARKEFRPVVSGG